MHIYHKAIMTSFVCQRQKQRGEREEEKEERDVAVAGTAELNHKAVDYKIISHGLSLSSPTL